MGRENDQEKKVKEEEMGRKYDDPDSEGNDMKLAKRQ